MKNIILNIGLGFSLIFFNISIGYAEQTLVAQRVTQEPVIDGQATDHAWSKARKITTHDKVANIDVVLKAVYTAKKIFFLVTYPDKENSSTHRSNVWNSKREEYDEGKDIEDVFVLKWSMNGQPVDLSIYADNTYSADLWFWKACRTDPVGYADDKIQYLNTTPKKRAKELISRSGKKMYLQRMGDHGDSAFQVDLSIEYKGDVISQFSHRQPSLSRADIRAKGVWQDGMWTIELGRALQTNNTDDIQFDIKTTYQFGISRYEIAGREKEPESEQPLFGCGDVTEKLTLKFGR